MFAKSAFDVCRKKKKSKKREQDEEQAEQDQLDDDRQMEGWVACESIQDWDGPILLLSTATEPPSILCAHEESEKITWRRLKEEEIGGGVGNASIEEFEPSQVYQVFVARRLIGGTESAPSQKISLRSAYDKYLGVDKFGVVECFREAVGPTEEWEVVKRDDGFVLKSAYDKFLKLDIDGGASSTTSGTVLARADAEQAGFLETLLAKCQAERKHRKDKKRKKQKEIDAAELEIEQM